MTDEEMFALALKLGEVKSRQDAKAAVALQHEDMVLETPAFGSVVRGNAENHRALAGFFMVFPDYHVTLEGHASNGEHLLAWGKVRMTLKGDAYGLPPTGKTATLPCFLRFTFKDGLIASEYFMFDMFDACMQWGLDTDLVRARFFPSTKAA